MSKFKSPLPFIKNHKKTSIAAVIILVLLILIFRPKAPKEIATQKVTQGDIKETVSASGNVSSQTSVDLTFPTGGKLVYLGVQKGDQVAAGQTIASLDTRTVEKNMQTALANYSEQRNTFDATKQQNNDHTPENALSDDMKRILENNQYDLNKAIYSVELQDLAKQQSYLTTPISGTVVRSDVTSAGVNVTPATTFTIADPDNLIFKVDVDEADIGKIHLGEPIAITLDAFPDQTINASVNYIDFASHATSTGGTAYTVQAALPLNTSDTYRIGMNGDAEITISEHHSVLVIPLSALIDDSHVFVKTGKTFEKRAIKTGIQSDIDIEVTDGLKSGDQVALQPDDVTKQYPLLAK
jgi:HlyD family secretion protein